MLSILKSTSIAAAALICSSTLAFSQQTVSWWYEQANPEQQKAMQDALIDKFDALKTGHKLKIDYRGNELDKHIRVALLSGTGPDVVMTPGRGICCLYGAGRPTHAIG